jgi:hypothetical protein
MQKILYPILTLLMTLPLNGCSQNFNDILKQANDIVNNTGELTSEEVGLGLKEALDKGIQQGVQTLAQENGYYESVYKILLPEEADQVISKLRVVPGFDNLEQELILRINRGAELAVEKAAPIFGEAIKQLTFQDAFNILMGEQNAATQYLVNTTEDPLYEEFRPVIASALDEVHARELWNKAVSSYNGLPFVKKVNPDLDDYVAHKAMDGLFDVVEKKEIEIRDKVSARTSPLLKKVFAAQDK